MTMPSRVLALVLAGLSLTGPPCAAQDNPPAEPPPAAQPAKPEKPAEEAPPPPPQITLRKLMNDAGAIGMVILALSVAMVALIVEHLISIRRGALMPPGLAEQTHLLLMQGQAKQAEQVCQETGSFLGRILAAGLAEVGLDYASIEKAMEDAAVEQAARLFRKIEYLSVISTLAPMLGLLGTVWGMILAFMEFEQKANPQVSELAPGIYGALVTTLFGLIVAVPALAAFAFFRNRIDELAAEASLLADHVFADYRRTLLQRQRGPERKPPATPRPEPRRQGSPSPPP